MSSPSPDPTDVLLRAKIERVDETLRIAYSLQNQSGDPIGVYDGAGEASDQEWPDVAGLVYVSLESRDTIAIKRVLAPEPAGMRIHHLKLPAATRLDPGQTRNMQFSLPLPLAEHSEYFPPYDGAEWREGEVGTVRLTIGFQRAGENAVFQPLDVNPDLFKLADGFGFQEFVSAEQQIVVTVRARVDPGFQRV